MASKQDIENIEIDVDYKTVETGYAQNFRKTINDNFELTGDNIEDLQSQIGSTLKHGNDYINLQNQLGKTKGATSGNLISIQDQLGDTKVTKEITEEGVKFNNTIQEQIDNLEEDLSELDDSLSQRMDNSEFEFNQKINDIKATIGNVPQGKTLQGQIGDVPDNKTLQSQIGDVPDDKTLQSQIDDINLAIGSASGDISDLSDRLNTAEDNINTNKDNININKDNIDTINEKLGSVPNGKTLQGQIGDVPNNKTLQGQIGNIDDKTTIDSNTLQGQINDIREHGGGGGSAGGNVNIIHDVVETEEDAPTTRDDGEALEKGDLWFQILEITNDGN